MDPGDLQRHAVALVAQPSDPTQQGPSRIERRRAVSSSYYAPFHTPARAGARAVAPADAVLHNQVARAFSHTAMRKVCDAYARSPDRPFPQALAHLNRGTADPSLTNVAASFGLLQDARHLADYDLLTFFVLADTLELVEAASLALDDFQAIQSAPGTDIFLTALLLSDRWTRRG